MTVKALNIALKQSQEEFRPIICDTMIWYHIAKGDIEIENIGKLHLVGTFVNVLELLTTSNFHGNEGHFSEHPLCSMLKHCKEFRLVDPLAYAYQKHNSAFVPSNQLTIDSVRDWIRNHESPSFGLDSRQSLEWTGLRENERIGFINGIEPKLTELRKKFSNKNHRRNYLANHQELIGNAKKGLGLEIMKNLGVIFNGDDFPWKAVAPYLACRIHYEVKMNLNPQMKANPNDARDLWNLLYVNPNELYLSLENKWNAALGDSALSEFVFPTYNY